MTECDKSGCQYLQTTCVTCGRIVCEKMLPKTYEWIKCSEKLPKCDQKVLCLTKDERILVALYDNYSDSLQEVCDFYLAYLEFGDLGKLFLGRADLYDSGYGEITHWMPLPPNPEK